MRNMKMVPESLSLSFCLLQWDLISNSEKENLGYSSITHRSRTQGHYFDTHIATESR
jgi:hypothetical protein